MVGFTRSEDAACIFRELKRRGLSGRKAQACLLWLMGISKSNIEKYVDHPIEPANAEHDTLNARFAVGKLLDGMGARAGEKLSKLENPAQGIVRAIARETGRAYLGPKTTSNL